MKHMYEYGNIKNAEVGDIVESTDKSNHETTKGKLYIIQSGSTNGSIGHFITDEDEKSVGIALNKRFWKLLKTKPGSEAKVGDTVIRFKHGTSTCPTGTVFTVLEVSYNSLYYARNLAADEYECKVLYKVNTEPATPRVAVVTTNANGHPIGSRIVPTNTSNKTWKLADNFKSSAYYHTIGENCEWADELVGSTWEQIGDYGAKEAGDIATISKLYTNDGKTLGVHYYTSNSATYRYFFTRFKKYEPTETTNEPSCIFTGTITYPTNACSEITLSPATLCSLPHLIPEEETMKKSNLILLLEMMAAMSAEEVADATNAKHIGILTESDGSYVGYVYANSIDELEDVVRTPANESRTLHIFDYSTTLAQKPRKVVAVARTKE